MDYLQGKIVRGKDIFSRAFTNYLRDIIHSQYLRSVGHIIENLIIIEIEKSELKRCVLLKVSGRIDSATAPRLQEAINEIANEGKYKLVLDVSSLEFISSGGLWVLVNAQKKCKRFNRGEVVLAQVPKRIHDTLDLAGFIPYFKIFEDSTAAVGSF